MVFPDNHPSLRQTAKMSVSQPSNQAIGPVEGIRRNLVRRIGKVVHAVGDLSKESNGCIKGHGAVIATDTCRFAVCHGAAVR